MITYQMLPRKYYHSLFKGLPYLISCDDPRYEKVKNNLHDLKPEHFTLYNELLKGLRKLMDLCIFINFKFLQK